jgi:phosphate:Na+ symporter
METFGTIFCGLGLFIIGVSFLGQNLKQVTGKQFKTKISRATNSKFISAFLGFLSGMFTQSGNASVFITNSLHTAGLLSINRALTIINWANIGTSVLIFVVVINLKLLALYLLGIIGMMYYLQMDKKNRSQLAIKVFLGLGLLFLGIHYMKTGAVLLESLDWIKDILHKSAGSVILLCFVGLILSVIIQSASAVSVISISLTSAGLLSADQTIIIVLGTGLGSAINILILSWNLTGTARQLSIYYAIFRTSGSILATIVVAMTHLFVQSSPEGSTGLSMPVGQQVALTYLMMVVLPAFFLTFLHKPVIKILEKIAPPTQHELLSKPRFIYEKALKEPVMALDLIEKEQLRLMGYLPQYLIQVGPERSDSPDIKYPMLNEGFQTVSAEIVRYLSEISMMPEALSSHERILQLQFINTNLLSLESDMFEFARTVEQSQSGLIGQRLAVNLIESLRAITETAIEGIASGQRTDLEITHELTNDRGELLREIRQQHLISEREIDLALRQSIFAMTLLFERIVWLIRSINLIKIKGL